VTVNADLQKLEPGALIEFYMLEGNGTGMPDTLYFHGQGNYTLIWDGQEYAPWPIKADGFARTSLQQPAPKLQVGNIDRSISLLCSMYDDLVGAKLTRRRTFRQYLDAANFPDGNPTADPTEEFPVEVWYIDRKAKETRDVVVFELASVLDFSGVQLPRRQIIANFCQWMVTGGYRGIYCGYDGPPVALPDDTPTSDPDLDYCGGRVSSCKMRYGENGKLPFGGFPAAGLIRT
jgi:lambda family phage minor tail protein L